MKRARDLGIDLFDVLRRHDTGVAMETLDDAIYTGIRPTNVQDLRVIYIGGGKR
jgi:glycerate-2-kinase